MRFGELPSTTASEPQPWMMCDYCGAGPFSANRGDYFMHSDDESVPPCECGGDMVLVREVHYFEPIETEDD